MSYEHISINDLSRCLLQLSYIFVQLQLWLICYCLYPVIYLFLHCTSCTFEGYMYIKEKASPESIIH